MKLPWDRHYLKICFHAVIAVLAAYILIICVNSAAYIITNLNEITRGISGFAGKILSVFSVVLVAFVMAYLLDPAVDFFQTRFEIVSEKKLFSFFGKVRFLQKIASWRGKFLGRFFKNKKQPKHSELRTRTAGTVILYLVIVVIAVLGVISVFLALGGKMRDISEMNLLEMISAWINDMSGRLLEFYDSVSETLVKWDVEKYFSDFITGLLVELAGFLNGISSNFVSVATLAGSQIANFFLSFVVAFYFLRDKERIKSIVLDILDVFVPDKIERRIKSAATEIHAVFSGYIRGQLLDGLIMMLLITAALSVIGVDFAVLIGIVSGFSNLIPYFGAIVGFVLSVFVSLISGSPSKALYAAAAIIVLQQIDGMFIIPKVVGKKVELSPALVLISLAVFGNLFGLPGMVLAVPVAAILKIFMSRLFARKKREMEINKL